MAAARDKGLYNEEMIWLKIGMALKPSLNEQDQEMLEWLKDQPGMYEKLKEIRALQVSDPDLNRAELELLELVQSIGASSFGEILQRKG